VQQRGLFRYATFLKKALGRAARFHPRLSRARPSALLRPHDLRTTPHLRPRDF
jgi:hypothetical protein